MNASRREIRLTVTAELGSLPRLLEAVDEVCDAAGVDRPFRHDLRLAVEEACVNVMRHAYRGSEAGELSLEVAPVQWSGEPAIRVLLRDHGAPFDPLALAPPTPQPADNDQLRIGGLGVHLMRQMTDFQAYHRDAAAENCLTLVKILQPRQGERE